ncbi:OmpA family protein [Brachymonas sp. G13]|uniref:OmpA family protein n=1 Tax=Brachymonas wangyanguii TaxID=3130163 RepID=UPI001691D0DD|nr:OmpA family protein [Ramlibacter sp.]
MSIDLTSVLKTKAAGLLTDYLQGQLGLSGDTASRSAALALPALLGKLVSQTDSGDNMTRLFNLITGPEVESGYDRIEPSLLQKGAKWLSLLFGDNEVSGLARLLGGKTGIAPEQGSSLLSAALPLVLGALRSQVETGKLSKPQFVGLLNEQKGFLARALDGSLLSGLGLGSLAAAVPAAAARAAAPVQQAASGGGWKKWLWIGALAALALLLLRMCNQQPVEQPSAAPASATASAPAVVAADSASEAAAAVLAASEAVPATDAASVTPAAPASAVALADDAVTWENGVLSVYFATGKTDVNQAAADAVSADIVALGKQGRKLVVSGYNDPRGDAALNAELSKKRAQAVQAYLIAQGVPESGIELRKPEQTDGASGNLAQDRRVDVIAE